MKICGIYKITNTITGDFYIGSSKDINRRWTEHKRQSTWNRCPNSPLYKDMQKYGTDSFVFEVIEEVEESFLKEKEQQFIETLNPIYNNRNASGWNIERYKESQKEYEKTEKRKESNRKANNKYQKSDKGKDSHRKSNNKYNNQLCIYNNETLTLCALSARFRRQGIPHPTEEAKKYLLQ